MIIYFISQWTMTIAYKAFPFSWIASKHNNMRSRKKTLILVYITNIIQIDSFEIFMKYLSICCYVFIIANRNLFFDYCHSPPYTWCVLLIFFLHEGEQTLTFSVNEIDANCCCCCYCTSIDCTCSVMTIWFSIWFCRFLLLLFLHGKLQMNR